MGKELPTREITKVRHVQVVGERCADGEFNAVPFAHGEVSREQLMVRSTRFGIVRAIGRIWSTRWMLRPRRVGGVLDVNSIRAHRAQKWRGGPRSRDRVEEENEVKSALVLD